MADRACRILLTVDGAFLALVGAVQIVFELLSHYRGGGPLGDTFETSPLTIGWVEAHGLALLIGLLLLIVARVDLQHFWHCFALSVHTLLWRGENVLFSSFVTFGLVPIGVAATVTHAVLVVAHTVVLVRRARPAVRGLPPE